MTKNNVLTFIFAFVPGAGQMYQGYMKRGLTLITLFCIGFAAEYILSPLGAAMLIVWMYSFFDTFNLHAKIAAGTAPADDYLVHIGDIDNPNVSHTLAEKHKLCGWVMIALGAVVFYQNVLMNTVGDLLWRWGQSNAFFRALYIVFDCLPSVVVGTVLVVCGIWLVRGPRAKKQPNAAEPAQPPLLEEFEEYKGGEE